jgi:hypothetical protein
LAAAAATPSLGAVLGVNDPASQDSTVRLEALDHDFEAELIESAELGHVRTGEARPRAGSVRHVEVFRMVSVRTSILGRPRRLSRDRHASARYTLICEEPHYGTWGR